VKTSIPHRRTIEPDSITSDPRDRLRSGLVRDLPTAAALVERGVSFEQAERAADCRADGVPMTPMSEEMAATLNAAKEAHWHWQQEHAEFVRRVTARLTDAGLFDWAEAFDRGDYSRLGW
jgi:hypothetical protein